MTELAVRDDRTDLNPTPAPAPAPQPEVPASALLLWAAEARQAAQIATSLARTSFVPASLRGKPEDITAAILAGQELGLRPMASLRSMDIIQGTPALRAHAMRGLVQTHGHSVQLVESSETRCVMRGRRAGEQEWQEVVWTIQRAEKLGLLGKDQWKKQPQTMLIARATGELCRLIAADALYAMPYATEEIDEGDAPPAAARLTAAEILGQRHVEPEAPAQPQRLTAAEIQGAAPRPAPPSPAPAAEDGWPQVVQPPADGES